MTSYSVYLEVEMDVLFKTMQEFRGTNFPLGHELSLNLEILKYCV